MKRRNWTRLIKTACTRLEKHSPEIMLTIGALGLLGTTVLAVSETPEAMRRIEAEKNRKNRLLAEQARQNGQTAYQKIDKLPAKDVVRVAWRAYIPAAVTGTLSTGCLIYAGSSSARKRAALAAACAFSNTALKEYQDKVVETVGEEGEKVIREAICQDKIDQNPVSSREVIVTGKGTELCFDPMSGRYFTSDDNEIQRIVNTLNYRMASEGSISLNEFYIEMDMKTIDIGDTIGWNIDRGQIRITTEGMKAENGKACLGLIYHTRPNYNF